ncbi:glutamate racemase [Flavobacterium sp. F372]|jgi:glutamate racemase|uniref:Glutamate racemase n=1 Tax=Flavobacterium bernardetii TaxID=2813823 RepID=A0ABR7J131_9FLAO|nr:glutamate racemase [Flavobacterium bernardetii]MBC5835702.1 glutamate racemase [Flavobacterium bernardetii]NHF69433.1 glutamate racemase [Flavobacterium bernardetii]
MSNKNPIGLFDSGVGGTSIWKEVHALLPNESTIYLADSKNAPYGQKTQEEIIELSKKNTEFLLKNNCKLIIVACNTATTNAIKALRASYDVPFIGIEPAIKPAALHSKTQKIGILATQGTLNSELFHQTVALYSDVKVVEQIGFDLVKLIENGEMYSKKMILLLEEYLLPMVAQDIDYLVLGCTHYPYLIPQIQKIIPKHIKIIDSGEAVAKQTKNILEINNLFNTSKNVNQTFYINNPPEVMQELIGDKFKVEYKDF